MHDVMHSVGAIRSNEIVIQYLDSCMIASHKQSFKQKINNKIGRRLVVDHEIFSYISHSIVATKQSICGYVIIIDKIVIVLKCYKLGYHKHF